MVFAVGMAAAMLSTGWVAVQTTSSAAAFSAHAQSHLSALRDLGRRVLPVMAIPPPPPPPPPACNISYSLLPGPSAAQHCLVPEQVQDTDDHALLIAHQTDQREGCHGCQGNASTVLALLKPPVRLPARLNHVSGLTSCRATAACHSGVPDHG